MTAHKVLVVEDSDAKFDAIVETVTSTVPGCDITRAATMIEADTQISDACWDLVILDISMDIAPSVLGPRSRGQANIGGLGIAHRMFLLDREFPTVIVTAFDSFSSASTADSTAEIIGFEEIRSKASHYLPTSLLGCLQYSSATWRSELKMIVGEALS
ncbi:response regulator [bacterium]|nr:MAG: response regulator [bacterium]